MTLEIYTGVLQRPDVRQIYRTILVVATPRPAIRRLHNEENYVGIPRAVYGNKRKQYYAAIKQDAHCSHHTYLQLNFPLPD